MKELTTLEISYLGLNPFAVHLLGESYASLRLRLPIVFGHRGVTYGIAPSAQALADYMSNSLDPTCTSLVTAMCERDRALGHLEYIKGNLDGIIQFSKGSPASSVRASVKNTLEKIETGRFSKRCWCGKCEFGGEATP